VVLLHWYKSLYWWRRESWSSPPPTYNPYRTWDSNPQPLCYESDSLTIRPQLPQKLFCIQNKTSCWLGNGPEDDLHKEGKTQRVITERGCSRSAASNWSWSQCIKSHHAQTSSGKELPNHFWTRNIVRSILPGRRRKWSVLLLSGPKSSLQMKVNLSFYL